MGPIGVVLMDLGGPSSLREVGEFIRRLLSDPAILPLPWGVRHMLAWWIAKVRSPKVRERYRAIGGRSPVPDHTRAQAEALAATLGPGFEVTHAFNYVSPTPTEAMERLARAGVQRVVGLPNFPQESGTTRGTCDRAMAEAAARAGLDYLPTRSFPTSHQFIVALGECTVHAITRLGLEHLLMTAHGLPVAHVRRGDPYPREVQATAEALGSVLPSRVSWSLAYQSRMGPAKWLEPTVEEELNRLARAGVRRVGVAPISFGCENLETLYDLDVRARDHASRIGLTTFHRCQAPGTNQAYIDALAEVVTRAAADWIW